MATKRIGKNISVDPVLLRQFDEAVLSNHQNRSRVLQDCMRAYLELSATCKMAAKRLPTLEFKGADNSETQKEVFPTSLLQVAGRKAGYGVETSKTKELARK